MSLSLFNTSACYLLFLKLFSYYHLLWLRILTRNIVLRALTNIHLQTLPNYHFIVAHKSLKLNPFSFRKHWIGCLRLTHFERSWINSFLRSVPFPSPHLKTFSHDLHLLSSQCCRPWTTSSQFHWNDNKYYNLHDMNCKWIKIKKKYIICS